MRVSIVVPAHNEEDSIGECLDSLMSLAYPADLFEIIVVDNNSSDNTARIIKQYPVKYFIERKKGSYVARNKGILAARGELIAFTDADCVVDRNWISNIVRGFDNNDFVGWGGRIEGYRLGNSVENFLVQKSLNQEKAIKAESGFFPYIITANAVYRKNILLKIGMFDPNLFSGGDVDLGWRLYRRGYRIRYVPDAVVYHKHKGGQMDIYWQAFKYGRGHSRLYRKHMEEIRDRLSSYLIDIQKLKRGLWQVIRCSLIKKDLFERYNFIFSLGHFCGRLYDDCNLLERWRAPCSEQ